MHRSILLRLLPPDRAGDRLAGVAEEVETGERAAFRDAEDLIAALWRLHDVPAGEPRDRSAGAAEPPPDG